MLSSLDPLVDNLPLQTSKPLDDSPEAARTAAALNEASRMIIEARPRVLLATEPDVCWCAVLLSRLHLAWQVLSKHAVNRARVAEGKPPGNCILLRGPGERIRVEPFLSRHGCGLGGAPVSVLPFPFHDSTMLTLDSARCAQATGLCRGSDENHRRDGDVARARCSDLKRNATDPQCTSQQRITLPHLGALRRRE